MTSADLGAAAFDTVIINSVAQYFPSADYLRIAWSKARVRAAGATAVASSSVTFRAFRYLETFHTSAQFRARAAGDDH